MSEILPENNVERTKKNQKTQAVMAQTSKRPATPERAPEGLPALAVMGAEEDWAFLQQPSMPAVMLLPRHLDIRAAAGRETLVRNCAEAADNFKSGVTQYRGCLPFRERH